MTDIAWRMSGQYMESCNCDYLCPCIYTNPQGPATHENCYALMAFQIESGNAGEVRLDGLCFAFVIRSGRVMADGGWVFAGVVDERADEAQRTALARIVAGDAGGTPGAIRGNLVSDFRGIRYQAIELGADGLQRSVSIPQVLGFEIEGVASRNGSGEPYYLDNTGHPANRRLALARSRSLWLRAFDLTVELIGKGNNGHFAPFAWSGS